MTLPCGVVVVDVAADCVVGELGAVAVGIGRVCLHGLRVSLAHGDVRARAVGKVDRSVHAVEHSHQPSVVVAQRELVARRLVDIHELAVGGELVLGLVLEREGEAAVGVLR